MPIPIPFTGPPDDAAPSAASFLAFYLVSASGGMLGSGYWNSMVHLPARGNWTDANDATGSYYLVAALTTAAQHAAVVAIRPQPPGWVGGVDQAKEFLRRNHQIHFWWLYDRFIARVSKPTPSNRFYCYFSLSDAGIWPLTLGIRTEDLAGGWEESLRARQFDEFMAICKNAVLSWPFGSFGTNGTTAYKVGYYPDGAPIDFIAPIGPRQLEEFYPAYLAGFVPALKPRSQAIQARGGEVMCYAGPAEINFTGSWKDWWREPLACRMTLGMDTLGALDPASLTDGGEIVPAVRHVDDAVAHHVQCYLEPNDRADGIFTQPFSKWWGTPNLHRSIVTPARQDLIEADPTHATWYAQTPKSNNMVWAVRTTDQQANYAEAKGWLNAGYRVACAGWNLTHEQLAELNALGAS